jgi:hypothetical protein
VIFCDQTLRNFFSRCEKQRQRLLGADSYKNVKSLRTRLALPVVKVNNLPISGLFSAGFLPTMKFQLSQLP